MVKLLPIGETYHFVGILEFRYDIPSLYVAPSTDDLDDGLFIGAPAFHSFVQSLSVLEGIEALLWDNSSMCLKIKIRMDSF